MRHHSSCVSHPSKQSGVVMFVALILLLILSLLGVTAARMQTVEERMARNEDNHQLGAQSAEAALRSAEDGLLTGIYINFSGNSNGLYMLDSTIANPSPVNGMQWNAANAAIPYTGPAIAHVPAPKFVIEQLPQTSGVGQSASVVSLNPSSPPVLVYRVTAQGTGADNTSTTTLQTIVR